MRSVTSLPYAIREDAHVWIPMSDGVRLAARIWRPVASDDDPVPAVLEFIPYRRRDLTAQRDSIHHPYMAGHGYACLRVDLRGSGDSEGVLTDEYLPTELDDAEQVLAWIAAQPWCDGSIGMMGISWGGFNALQVAARRPPGLGAIVTVSSTDDRYADETSSSTVGEPRTSRRSASGSLEGDDRHQDRAHSTPTDFIVHAQLDAYENDERVASQNWHTTIARDHI